MEELDLKEIIKVLLRKWWILALCSIVFAALAGIISFFVLEPTYESSTTLYIGKDTASKTDLAYNDVMLSTQLVKDYREIVKSNMIASEVIKELDLKDLTAKDLAERINVASKNDTRVFQISVQDKDPKMAARIANKVALVFQDKVAGIMKIENVQVIDAAQPAEYPVKPSKRMNIAIAFVLGLMLGSLVIFLSEYFDNTIKTAEDVKKYVDLPVIGTIPVFPE